MYILLINVSGYIGCGIRRVGAGQCMRKRRRSTYIDEVIEQALVRQIEDRIGMRRGMKEDDPRRISRHLAPVEPQTTCAIHEALVARFK